MSRNVWVIAGCLFALMFSLLLVGVVSDTVLRHVVQVVPVAAALVAVLGRAPWGRCAALPVFIFWLFIMLLIWLFLLGIASIVTGRFTPVEIALTVVMGVCCAWGIAVAVRTPTAASRTACVMWFLAFAVMQIGAMWVSLRPFLAND